MHQTYGMTPVPLRAYFTSGSLKDPGRTISEPNGMTRVPLRAYFTSGSLKDPGRTISEPNGMTRVLYRGHSMTRVNDIRFNGRP